VPVVADGLPDLTMPCLTKGPDVRLAGLRGTPTVVNVWASWCPPCRDELGFLADLQSRTRGDLRVLGIDLLDRPDAARAAIEDFGVNYPSVEDADGQVRSALNVQAPPVTYFVDAAGTITFTKVGQIRTQSELDALVRKHLGVDPR
jgi:thiol-disulfide isomerase/thioredoxin